MEDAQFLGFMVIFTSPVFYVMYFFQNTFHPADIFILNTN